jgi:hypothetical protein
LKIIIDGKNNYYTSNPCLSMRDYKVVFLMPCFMLLQNIMSDLCCNLY